MLVELLRAASREEEALEQLAKIAGDLEARGGGPPRPASETGEMERASPAAAAPRPSDRHAGRGDLVFLDTGFDLPVAVPPTGSPGEPPAADLPLVVEAPPPDGLELTQLDPVGVDEGDLSGDVTVSGLEQAVEADFVDVEVGPVPGLELDAAAGDTDIGDEPVELIDVSDDLDLALSATEVDFADAGEPDTDLDLDFVEDETATEPTAGLPLIEPATMPATSSEVEELEDRIVDDPENPDLHRELADRLSCSGIWPAPPKSCGCRSRDTSARKTGPARPASPTGWSRWSPTRSCTTRSASSSRSAPVSAPRCWMRTWSWATPSAGRGPRRRRWPSTVGSTSTIRPTAAPRRPLRP